VQGRLNIVKQDKFTFFEIKDTLSVKSNIIALNLNDFLKDQPVAESLRNKGFKLYLAITSNEHKAKPRD